VDSKLDVVNLQNCAAEYDQKKSRYYGSVKTGRFTLLLAFYSPDGIEFTLPLACISAYLKKQYDWIDIILKPILILRGEDKYSPSNYADDIAAANADMIAFSVLSPQWYSLEPYLAAIKAVCPQLPILIGGYQAMLSTQQTIDNPNVDIVCVGDGEYAMGHMVEFMRGKKSGPILGMWEKLLDGTIVKDKPVQTDDLNALPFPDIELFAPDGDFRKVNATYVMGSTAGLNSMLVMPVMTGRGCPYKCTYCCNTPLLETWQTKKTFLRKYEPQALVDELIRLRDKYGVGYFEFWDELFLSNLKFVRAFLALYKEQLRLPFSINSRVEVMSEDFCKTVAEAGCSTIWFGIESGDEEYRKRMLGRKMTNQQIISAAENCKNAGINRLTFNITGMPMETAKNMRNTLALNRKIEPEHFYFFNYIPLRGTPLYESAKKVDLLLTQDRDLLYIGEHGDNYKYRLNLKEQNELLNAEEYNEICHEMYDFQQRNNRVNYGTIEIEQKWHKSA